MPKFDLLLLPLVGGYLFLITFTLTKFYHQRIERQRLIFNSIIVGFFISIIGFAIDEILLKSCCLLPVREWFSENNPISYSGLNHSILIFLISYPLAKLFSVVIPKKTALTFVVERWGDQMEWLFWKSLNHRNDAEKLLMLTTKSNKVYVAYVNKISEPIGDPFVTLIPNFSGYRDKETQEFIITTDYFDVLEKFIAEDKASEIDQNLGITIPISEILMVSRFNMSVFSDFNDIDDVEDGEEEIQDFV